LGGNSLGPCNFSGLGARWVELHPSSRAAACPGRRESTRVHSGVDRFDADGIGVLAPESTNPATPPGAKKHSIRGPGRTACGDRVASSWRIIMRATLRQGHVQHLLRAMGAGKDRDFRASNCRPLPIMKSPRARNSRPWMGPGAFSSEIEARPPGNLRRPEKQFFSRAQQF
jgi:hypothetical protein